MLSGTNLDKLDQLYSGLERASRVMATQIDVPEATGRQSLMLYSGVTNYLADPTIFGSHLVDIRPQGDTRNEWDYVYKVMVEPFDRTKHCIPNGYLATFEYDQGTPIVRIASPKPLPKVELDAMDSTTGWAVGGSASGLALDTTVYYQYPGALRFTLTGSSTGTLIKTLTSTLDLSSYRGVGVAFLAIEIPPGSTATDLTNIALSLGSSNANYDTVTATQGFLGAWVAGDYLLVAFDFSTSVPTGTADWTKIDYIKLAFAHTATFTNFRVGGLWISLPAPTEILFDSAAIFMASGQNPAATITDDTDTIILNDATYTIYQFESALAILLDNGGSLSAGLGGTYTDILHNPERGLYPKYRADNPSQQIRTTGNWYND